MTALLPNGPFTLHRQTAKPHPSASKGHSWPKSDLVKYAVFLDFFKSNSSVRLEEWSNEWSFFRKLSIFLQSKNPNQCRIFHKNMLAQHDSLHQLIAQLRKNIEQFEDWASSYYPALVNVSRCLAREETGKQPMQTQTAVEHTLQSLLPLQGLEMNEKDKEEMKPTDTGYLDEEEEEQPRGRPVYPHITISRPSFSLPAYEDTSCYNFPLDTPTLSRAKDLMMSGLDSRNKDQWEDCHRSFLTYMEKLNTLMKGTASQF